MKMKYEINERIYLKSKHIPIKEMKTCLVPNIKKNVGIYL